MLTHTKLIGINGRIKSGKDTIADYILSKQPWWTVKKYAGKLKEITSLLTGCTLADCENQFFKKNMFYNVTTGEMKWRENLPQNIVTFEDVREQYPLGAWISMRVFMQDLGTQGLRSRWENIWVNALFADYPKPQSLENTLIWGHPNWLITDMRFPNEAKAIKNRGGITVRINRPGTKQEIEHASETSLDNYNFDYVIENDGTMEELFQKVDQMLTIFKLD